MCRSMCLNKSLSVSCRTFLHERRFCITVGATPAESAAVGRQKAPVHLLQRAHICKNMLVCYRCVLRSHTYRLSCCMQGVYIRIPPIMSVMLCLAALQVRVCGITCSQTTCMPSCRWFWLSSRAWAFWMAWKVSSSWQKPHLTCR